MAFTVVVSLMAMASVNGVLLGVGVVPSVV